MTDFMANAACKGLQPRKIVSRKNHYRPQLISLLMRERDVARFICAPGGFGKTALACSYAEVVFSFEHVFWIDARSPYFLRYLDRGELASVMLKTDPDASLAVFDDIPRLDEVRADLLSRQMDELLEHGCEVMALVAPTGDLFADRQRDRMLIVAEDLMIAPEEEAANPIEVPLGRGPAAVLHEIGRVPGIGWGAAAGIDCLLRGMANEGMPARLLQVLFIMLGMQQGALADVEGIVGPCGEEFALIREWYPYVSLDDESGTFTAVSVEPSVLMKRMKGSLGAIAACYEGERHGVDLLLRSMADALLVPSGSPARRSLADAADAARRACVLMGYARQNAFKAEWLMMRNGQVMGMHAAKAASWLYKGLASGQRALQPQLCAQEAWRRCLLGNEDGAWELADGVLRSPRAEAEAKLMAAALVLWMSSRMKPDADRASNGAGHPGSEELLAFGADAVSRLLHPPRAFDPSWFESLESPTDDSGMVIAKAAASMAYSLWSQELSRDDAFALWCQWAGGDLPYETLAFVTSWLVDAAVREGGRAYPEAVSCLRMLLEVAAGRDGAEDAVIGYLHLEAYKVYVRFCARGRIDWDVRELSAQARAAYAAAQGIAARETVPRMGDDAAAVPGRIMRETEQRNQRARVEAASVPHMSVRLFGRLEVTIGAQSIDIVHLPRRKTGVLLAFLALDLGREVSRDKLTQRLWPDSPVDSARRNLYTLLSILRNSLASSSGECPYLVRAYNGYMLDDRLVSCDADRVNRLCRGFADPSHGAEALNALLDEFKLVYTGNLMPSETKNEAILAERDAYRLKAVDGMLTAVAHLLELQEEPSALRFARSALDLDDSREDVYIAIMRCQLALGQRTPALQTYLSCRRHLTEHLGIDPSARAVRLYRSIIEEEADFD